MSYEEWCRARIRLEQVGRVLRILCTVQLNDGAIAISCSVEVQEWLLEHLDTLKLWNEGLAEISINGSVVWCRSGDDLVKKPGLVRVESRGWVSLPIYGRG
jgi:hypothetical protein